MNLSLTEQLNLLDLYDHEIKSRIACNITKISAFEPLIHSEQLDQLLVEYAADEDMFSQLFWQKVRNGIMKSLLYNAVLEFARSVDYDLHSMICVERYSSEYIVGLKKLLPHAHEVMAHIKDLETFIYTLREAVPGLEDIIDPIISKLEYSEMTEDKAKKLLLRCIPIITVYGYEHLLFALSQCDQQSEAFVESIYKNLANEYAIEAAHKEGVKARNAVCAKIGKIPNVYYRACFADMCKEKPLNLRNYQEELVKEACQGHNTVICAPTGSGKTVAGAYIARHHFYKAVKDKSYAKICFFVPTAALVEQQEALLSKYLGHFSKVCGISGQTSFGTPNRQTIESKDVVVVTPQIILNMLNERPREEDDPTYRPFLLTTFTLLIFDEAHHANEQHPYNQIMEIYHELKESAAHKYPLPQIVGLTASLGMGGSSTKKVEDAVQYTLLMCANLGVTHISRVRHHLDELKQYNSDTDNKIEVVPCREYIDSGFYSILSSELKFFEAQLLKIPEAMVDKEIKCLIKDKNSAKPLTEAYGNWLFKFQKEIVGCRLCSDSRETLNYCIDQLKIFYTSIDLLRLFGSASALQYIEKSEEEFIITKSLEITDHIKHTIECLKQQPKYESALLKKLIEILDQQFESQEHSRVIIFLLRREYCRRLADLLNEMTKHPSNFLTGVGARPEEGGQNAAAQKQKIRDFAEGRTKVLCATTVAEEGLDISGCSLVIEYNNVSNEIGHVQRRGRGRAKNSKSLLLTLDVEIMKRSEQNSLREALMNLALDMVDDKGDIWFTRELERHAYQLSRNRLHRKCLADGEIEKMKKKLLSTNMLCCAGIVDPEFWSRVTVDGLSSFEKEQAKFQTMASPHIGKHFCKNVSSLGYCGNILGRVLLHERIKLPTISCSGVIFVEVSSDYTDHQVPDKSRRFLLDKWKKVKKDLFHPTQLESIDLKEMQEAEKRHSNLLQLS
uniref:RNA helicase n=1 Tax=Ditylenchus dipsaci TaxID=166011 RepID=A0A915ESB8_9BILA